MVAADDTLFNDCRVSHSLSSINTKPQTKGQEQMTKEINEAMKKFKDVEHLIHAAAGANTKSELPADGYQCCRRHDLQLRWVITSSMDTLIIVYLYGCKSIYLIRIGEISCCLISG